MNAGLAAAVMQITKKGGSTGACFNSGKQGHLKRQFPERGSSNRGNGYTQRPKPVLCPRCKKGNHWPRDCKSGKDFNRQPFAQGYGGTRPKNGQRGPRPQVPQTYGAIEN